MPSVCTYGGFTHQDNGANLVNVDYRTTYSPRNKKLTQTRTMRIVGELNYDTTAALISAASGVISAYSQNKKDFTYSVGSPTPAVAHSLLNGADCLSGVRVIDTSFPTGDPAELATTRTFSVTLQGVYDVCEDDNVSWRESVEVTGNGSPLYVVTDSLFGPIATLLSYSTAIYYRQYGSAVGFNSYPVPPGPLNQGWEFGHRRRITNTSGVQQGTGIRYYTTSWSYYMATPAGAPMANIPTSK